jgi:hypothetical protein
MIRVSADEILRLKRLHRAADLELAPLSRRLHPSSAEELAIRDLKKRKLQLKDRIQRLSSIPPSPATADDH